MTKQQLLSLIADGTLVKQLVAQAQAANTSDLDDFVYDLISNYDDLFSAEDDWFSEEGTDSKDALRDEVLSQLN